MSSKENWLPNFLEANFFVGIEAKKVSRSVAELRRRVLEKAKRLRVERLKSATGMVKGLKARLLMECFNKLINH